MNTLIVVLGPTGIGKTDLAIELAKKLDTEIISADSRQFYKELKIGTAPPSKLHLNEIKHHFIGNLSINNYYNASIFEISAIEVLKKLFKTKKTVILVGGSGMYIDAVCNGIDDLPEIDQEIYYEIVDLKNHKRILKGLEICMMTGKTYTSYRKAIKKARDFNMIKIGLNMDRSQLYERIDKRVDSMIDSGLLEEAKEFYQYKNINALNTVGYKEIFDYLDGEYDLNKAIELIKRNSRRYAKRQLSWFMRDKEINWFEPSEYLQILNFINQSVL